MCTIYKLISMSSLTIVIPTGIELSPEEIRSIFLSLVRMQKIEGWGNLQAVTQAAKTATKLRWAPPLEVKNAAGVELQEYTEYPRRNATYLESSTPRARTLHIPHPSLSLDAPQQPSHRTLRMNQHLAKSSLKELLPLPFTNDFIPPRLYRELLSQRTRAAEEGDGEGLDGVLEDGGAAGLEGDDGGEVGEVVVPSLDWHQEIG